MRDRIRAFVTRQWPLAATRVELHLTPIRGGLESCVTRADLHGSSAAGMPRRLVVKHATREAGREAAMYDWLWQNVPRPPAVRLFGRETAADGTYLYLEHAQACSRWPWVDTNCAAAVCRALARLHGCPTQPAFTGWDYERELAASAEDTLSAARTWTGPDRGRPWQRLGDLTRVVAALPDIRAHLLASGTTVLHGDVHTGNAIVRPRRAKDDIVLIDWARARLGSPLEDLASWLHSVGCWEPQARRRHDTLWRAYLEARGKPAVITSDDRRTYWFASASNGLAGAIRYHLAVLTGPSATPVDRRRSQHALARWATVIRRASTLVRTSRGY